MKIKRICVVGGGIMGRQIALNAAIHGFEAVVYARREATRSEVELWKDTYLAGRIEKGRLTEEQVNDTKARFFCTSSLEEAVKGADCVIEAINEVEEQKRTLFKQLSELVDEDVIIATNSSYMVSSMFVDCVKNPARLANAHFYNPALVMKLVEVVQGPHTSTETAEALMEFCTKCGKTPIWMKKEIDGFAANRLTRVVAREARFLVQNGYLTPEEVDIAAENGLGYPMGPFRLVDLTGIDLSLDILRKEYETTGVKPDCYDLYTKMVEEGRLGRKTGRGFYEYK